ncbi:MAG: cytochrome b [Wenzhouxiangella sp.]|nr:MAG: cytochrome b [Wenzhouxiangella sp.]
MKIPLRNTPTRYGLVSQLFHWLVVGLIVVQYAWAWRIDNVEGFRARLELVTQHKTIGMVVLALAVLRLLWRLCNRPPPLPGGLARWEVLAARAGHGMLYGLIFAIPLSGWLYSSAAGLGDFWWGPVNFPSLVESSEDLEDLFGLVHRALGVALAAVAGIHVVAALRHHFVLKDTVLKRMLPIWPQDRS